MRNRILGPLAATALVVASGILFVLGGASPAAAAGCAGDTGITVVVDFAELGGGVTAGCDANGGGPAANNFADAGYQLAYQEGMVCQVQGKPASGPCVESNAFWSLWWSDGTSGEWVFASRGVDSLVVPDGGYVAFAWHQGEGRAESPGVAATPREPEPTPEPSEEQSDNDGGGFHGGRGHNDNGSNDTTPSDEPSEEASPSESPSNEPSDTESEKPGKGKRKNKNSDEPTGSPSDEPSDDDSDLPGIDEIEQGPPAEATADEQDSSVPTWLAIGGAIVVIGAAGAVAAVRRRAG